METVPTNAWCHETMWQCQGPASSSAWVPCKKAMLDEIENTRRKQLRCANTSYSQ